jgi:hypothetical protein
MLLDVRNVLTDGILTSPKESTWEPTLPEGSLYLTAVTALRRHLREFGDWRLYSNCITQEVLYASEFEGLAKKYYFLLHSRMLNRSRHLDLE